MNRRLALTILATAFTVNLFWEAFHYRLYIPLHPLVQLPGVTLGAAVLDALWILGIFVFIKSSLKLRVITAILLSLLIEQWAILYNVWQYHEKMPVIPIVKAGLSPLLQLGLTVLVVEAILYLNRLKVKTLR